MRRIDKLIFQYTVGKALSGLYQVKSGKKE